MRSPIFGMIGMHPDSLAKMETCLAQAKAEAAEIEPELAETVEPPSESAVISWDAVIAKINARIESAAVSVPRPDQPARHG